MFPFSLSLKCLIRIIPKSAGPLKGPAISMYGLRNIHIPAFASDFLFYSF